MKFMVIILRSEKIISNPYTQAKFVEILSFFCMLYESEQFNSLFVADQIIIVILVNY